MYRTPTLASVKRTAARFGIELEDDEAGRYREFVTQRLKELDLFLQRHLEHPQLPRFPGARSPGWRPRPSDDPGNAWLWRCHVEGTPGGLLDGRRVSFKDHIAVAGHPMTFGSLALQDHVPEYDATVVLRTLEQGGHVVGKHTMNGLSGGFDSGGGFGDFARPLNPHRAGHASGGSSSGSAVALVRGETDISFGGDQGGSVRIPASWCGTVGLKPTFGLISHFGAGFGSDQSIDHIGPMAMTVRNVAVALDAVAGYDGLDPRQGRQVPDRYDSLSHLDRGAAGIRVGILQEGLTDASADVRDSFGEAVEALQRAGAEITDVSVPEHREVDVPMQALNGEGSLSLRQAGYFGAWAKTLYPESTTEAVAQVHRDRPFALDPAKLASNIAAEYSRLHFGGRVYARAQNVRGHFVQAYDRALDVVDVLLMPTTLIQAHPFEVIDDHAHALEYALFAENLRVRNTLAFNYTGHPALAVPTSPRGGLPVSMQLVGRAFQDSLLLRLAQAYVEQVPFSDHIAWHEGTAPDE